MSVLNFAHLNWSVQKTKQKNKQHSPKTHLPEPYLASARASNCPSSHLACSPPLCGFYHGLEKFDLIGHGVTVPLNVPLQFQWCRMSSRNCCAHYWTQSIKCIHLAWEHDCEKGEIKNGTAFSDGINRRLEQMAAAGTGWEDAGKRLCVCHAGVLIKAQRGRLSACLSVWEKLINTQVIPFRSPSCSS